jgi:hypothetical protein
MNRIVFTASILAFLLANANHRNGSVDRAMARFEVESRRRGHQP